MTHIETTRIEIDEMKDDGRLDSSNHHAARIYLAIVQRGGLMADEAEEELNAIMRPARSAAKFQTANGR